MSSEDSNETGATHAKSNNIEIVIDSGRFRDFEKAGALYVGHHGWAAKKILVFRWSKKAEITLETISFWQNAHISIFKFSPFLSIKSYYFFKIYQRFGKEREKNTHRAVSEKRKTENSWTLFYSRLFYKAL